MSFCRTLRICLPLLVLVVLAACAVKSGRLGEADQLRASGRYAEADAAYSQIIAIPDNDRQMAGAFYYRGLCRQAQGQAEAAYTDFLSARSMACVLNEEDVRQKSNVGILPMGSLCRELTAQGLSDSGKALSSEIKSAAAEKAQLAVPPAYRESK